MAIAIVTHTTQTCRRWREGKYGMVLAMVLIEDVVLAMVLIENVLTLLMTIEDYFHPCSSNYNHNATQQ